MLAISIGRAILAVNVVGLVGVARSLDDRPMIVPAAEARNHIGETCVVKLNVRASKNAVNRKVYFLDSEEDFHDPKNFAVIISYEHAERFAKAGIENPAEYYRGKTIRVSGKVISEDDQTRFRVDDPKQITLTEQQE
jgi:hypothetical protein